MVVTVCGRARGGSSMVAPRPGWPLLGDPQRGREPGGRGDPARGRGARRARGGGARGHQRGRSSCGACPASARRPRSSACGLRAAVGSGRRSSGSRGRPPGGGGWAEGRGRGEGGRPARAGRRGPAASSPVAGRGAAQRAPGGAQGRGGAARRRGRGVPASCGPSARPRPPTGPASPGAQPPPTCLLPPDGGLRFRAPRGHRGLPERALRAAAGAAGGVVARPLARKSGGNSDPAGP